MAKRAVVDSMGRRHDPKTGKLLPSGKKKKKATGKKRAAGKRPKASKGKKGKRKGGGRSVEARLSALEHNQTVIVGAVKRLSNHVMVLTRNVNAIGSALSQRFGINGGRSVRQLGAGG